MGPIACFARSRRTDEVFAVTAASAFRLTESQQTMDEVHLFPSGQLLGRVCWLSSLDSPHEHARHDAALIKLDSGAMIDSKIEGYSGVLADQTLLIDDVTGEMLPPGNDVMIFGGPYSWSSAKIEAMFGVMSITYGSRTITFSDLLVLSGSEGLDFIPRGLVVQTNGLVLGVAFAATTQRIIVFGIHHVLQANELELITGPK